ncbi:penicillin-binding protein activator [Aliidiomarina sanyensis]|uniref:penicillin-binding protein activator n=1 Tax=Aliidiomarina sanyensis TaxID=1249555 RepID=UPI0013006F4D|nr:penicillin-binding protein activator [Aliidiomarina sanyensis]
MPKLSSRCIPVFALSLITLGLTGCSSPPEPSVPPSERATPPAAEQVTPLQDPRRLIAQAKEASRTHEQHEQLVTAATLYLDQGAYDHAAAVLSYVDARQLRPEFANLYRLQQARVYASLDEWARVLELTDNLERQFSQRQYRAEVLDLRFQAFYAKRDYLSATLMRIEQKRYDDQVTPPDIWDVLKRVSFSELQSRTIPSDENTRGWIQLATRLHQSTQQGTSAAQALASWQRSYPSHPAQPWVAERAEQTAYIATPQVIGVLLPLSGQFASQGQAVRNGILAAATSERREQLHFFDTTTTSMSDIHAQLLSLEVELVIGPLVREHIENFRALEPGPWQQLWLNQVDDPQQGDRVSAFFALDLTSEVQVAAQYLAQKGHRNVLLLGPDTSRGRQMSALFSDAWESEFGARSVRTGLYTSSSDMVDIVRASLRVDASQQRIEALERNLQQRMRNEELHHEFRSRQDIDAIYLLGDAQQARLLKPYVDVNLSAFGSRIPMYASSAIHQEQTSRGQNDLAGITFSDAPFLVNPERATTLRQTIQEVMPSASMSQQRLIAMGYDAMQLAVRLPLMSELPGYRYQGLTGTLRISDHIVVRELDWATFEGHSLSLEHTAHVEQVRR